MRDLLLRDNKLNWQFIVPVCCTFVLLFISSTYEYFAFVFRSFAASGAIIALCTQALPLLLTLDLIVWAMTLKRAPADSKASSFVYPIITMSCLHVAVAGLRYALYPNYSETPVRLILQAGVIVLGVCITVFLCEFFYTRFRDKLLLFQGSAFVSSMIALALGIPLSKPSYASDGPSILRTMFTVHLFSACVGYALVLLIIKWRNLPLPMEQTGEQRLRHALREQLRAYMKQTADPRLVVPAMQQAFPTLSQQQIMHEFRRAPHPQPLASYKYNTVILIVVLALSGYYTWVQRQFITTDVSSGRIIIQTLLQWLLAAAAVLKLLAAGDLFHDHPRAYVVAIVVLLFSGIMQVSDIVFYQRDPVIIIIAAVQGIAVCLALSALHAIYPHYHVGFQRNSVPMT